MPQASTPVKGYPNVAPIVLGLAENGNANYQVRSDRGYICVLRPFRLHLGERLPMTRKVLKTAARDDERKRVLDS